MLLTVLQLSAMSMTLITSDTIGGVILANGTSRRMGGLDKSQLAFGQSSLRDHISNIVAPQVAQLVINAQPPTDPTTQSTKQTTQTLYPFVPDNFTQKKGPLAGILAAMDWFAKHQPTITHLLVVPCDCPFLPSNLVDNFLLCFDHNTQGVYASSCGKDHYVVSMWCMTLANPLCNYIKAGNAAVKTFIQSHSFAPCQYPNTDIDPFFNINTDEDYQYAISLSSLIDLK